MWITTLLLAIFAKINHFDVLRINSSLEFKALSQKNLERLLIKSGCHTLTSPSGGNRNCYSLILVLLATVK
jgi:hypothetical protein